MIKSSIENIQEKRTIWRKSNFAFCKIMLEREYLKNKINLFKEYESVLSSKEKKELKMLQRKWNSQMTIGTTNKGRRR